MLQVFRDQVNTSYRNIFRLPPGHILEADANGARTQRYWALDPEREIKFKNRGDYVEGFRENFREAVECRLRSQHPVGTALSGGLDSSSITVTAAKLLQDRQASSPHACSVVFPSLSPLHPEIDEKRFVEIVRRKARIVGHDIRGDLSLPFADTPYDDDEPLPALSLYMSHPIYRKLKELNARIYLTGHGGDDIVSVGDDHFSCLARSGRWEEFVRVAAEVGGRMKTSPEKFFWMYGLEELIALAREGKWGRFLSGSRIVAHALNVPHRQLLIRAGVQPFLPDDAQNALRRVLGRKKLEAQRFPLERLINHDFARRLGMHERWQDYQLAPAHSNTPVRAELVSIYESGVWEFVASVLGQASASYGIDQRFPYYDKRLVEYCIAIPHDQKIHDGWTRSLLREAMNGILPPEIQWRTSKGNLFGNLQTQMRKEIRTRLRNAENQDMIHDYFNMKEVMRVAERFETSPSSVSQEDFFGMFYAVRLSGWLSSNGVQP
jgi:asparagine synthase (glutamine-hydrolysing)